MKSPRNITLLDEMLRLLISHFGLTRVRLSLERFEKSEMAAANLRLPTNLSNRKKTSPTMIDMLELTRETDQEKYRLLSNFYDRLKKQSVLPEAQDIRHFAQLIGLKKIEGKSRKELIPKLMVFLLDIPLERLGSNIQSADAISDQQRQKGFSVLTDKLLGEK